MKMAESLLKAYKELRGLSFSGRYTGVDEGTGRALFEIDDDDVLKIFEEIREFTEKHNKVSKRLTQIYARISVCLT